jgi:hypothetical protein
VSPATPAQRIDAGVGEQPELDLEAPLPRICLISVGLIRSGACDRKRPNSARVAGLLGARDRKRPKWTPPYGHKAWPGAHFAVFPTLRSAASNAKCQKLARSESLMAELSSDRCNQRRVDLLVKA